MIVICKECGKEIETLPLECAHSININIETNQVECYMEKCGAISFDEYICESCCTNRNIMKLNKKIKQLSIESKEFKKELSYFKRNLVQAKVNNSNLNFWVEFGDGVYLWGKGIKEHPSITINSSQEIMYRIFKGNFVPFKSALNKNLKIEGDIQYALVFFDLINLANQIIQEPRGVLNEQNNYLGS